MQASSTIRALGLAAVLGLLGTVAASASDIAEGEWSTRVQILYDAQSKTVARALVRVWNAEPAKNLEFLWEPDPKAPAQIAPDSTLSGKGTLTWRVRGSASYDPRAVYSVYKGLLANGRPNGAGRLELRSGEVFEGNFLDGALDGRGVHIARDGSRYEGDFRRGIATGKGRLALPTGELYEGSFVAGLRDGTGRTTLPGGSTYASRWSMGREIGGERDRLADATIGGLLKAQAGGGGDAGKVEIAISVDERMNQESEQRYVQNVGDDAISIFPENEQMNAAWRGDGEVGYDSIVGGMDWENVPAFVDVDLRTTDGSRVKLDAMELKVRNSIAYRKPILTLEGHRGCVGFRPTFTVKNNGWGDAKNVKLSVQFKGEQEDGPLSRAFPVDVASITDGIDVSLEETLRAAGVETDKLASQRFHCQSRDSLNVCRSQVTNSVKFGELADYVWGEDKLSTTATGKIDYDWTDDYDRTYHQSETFRVDIALATIELPEEAAECGDGFGGAPDAPRFQDVKFPINQQDYTIPMPVRGNKRLQELQSRLKLSADMMSYHEFTVSARFSDGSERQSKPVAFFFFRPKPSAYVSTSTPAQCYLPEEAGGC